MGAMLVIALLSLPLMLLVNPCVNSKKADSEDEDGGAGQVHEEVVTKTEQQS